MEKISPSFEITSNDVLIFRVTSELDNVVEMGLYKEFKRSESPEDDLMDMYEKEDTRKKAR